jgi:2-methylcitrate dehydratase PrpD
VQLRNQHDLKPEQIAKVTLKVHSLVLELTGKKTPADGLQAKFSVYHSCAAGLIFGRAGEHEYADEIVNRPDVVALRSKVEAIVDDSIDEASVDLTIQTTDGRTLHVFVEHAIGSVERPMSDEQLKAKFVDQSAPVIGKQKAEQAFAVAMRLADCADAQELLRAARPD